MDAGLAAVLGALAGAAGTIGAAAASGRSSRQQSEIAARAEHRRQRRDPREAVYKRFIAAATAMRDHVRRMPDFDLFPATMFNAAYVQRAVELADALKEQWLDVALAGPNLVAEAATRMEEASRRAALNAEWISRLNVGVDLDEDEEAYRRDNAWRLQDLTQDWQHAAADLVAHLTDFIALAQSALDDDGTRAV